eukprot:CAMPEP_0198283538 /NCGR_PEP_ID=MMETSP1449-20131203/3105_1 /TAXON_ID=420275 /ORGANISM="Attheya septentrionalis, Strain CCMP2084" /LENGTH=581 /DNA_ID=CAMNT_0043980183 /DNA_START=154 /DNA_END=1899 /DNA_ORIENTATION=-
MGGDDLSKRTGTSVRKLLLLVIWTMMAQHVAPCMATLAFCSRSSVVTKGCIHQWSESEAKEHPRMFAPLQTSTPSDCSYGRAFDIPSRCITRTNNGRLLKMKLSSLSQDSMENLTERVMGQDASDEEPFFDEEDGIPLTMMADAIENEEVDPNETEPESFPEGIPKGFQVIRQWQVPSTMELSNYTHLFDLEMMERLSLTNVNASLPAALMMLIPQEYSSFSKARKVCRKGGILLHRGPLPESSTGKSVFDLSKCIRGRVGDRVFPGDVIGFQVRMGGGFYPEMRYEKPPFELPVVYEDDHFAIVNKPAGIVVYSHRGGGHGSMTVRAQLPFVLRPPAVGTRSVIRRPQTCHRLDKPTSGLLIVAKTKPAMVHISGQFAYRKVKKTYHAIINGIPDEPLETKISSVDAHAMGVDIDPTVEHDWQLIDSSLDEKSATTVWRSVEYTKSLKAKDNTLTLVELKPKTGRYHQLRRHMAWVRERSIVGDKEYDGGGDAWQLRGSGLFLCSSKVILEHPYFNSPEGREEWDAIEDESVKYHGGMIRLSPDGKVVQIHASINLPEKFSSLQRREQQRAETFAEDTIE